MTGLRIKLVVVIFEANVHEDAKIKSTSLPDYDETEDEADEGEDGADDGNDDDVTVQPVAICKGRKRKLEKMCINNKLNIYKSKKFPILYPLVLRGFYAPLSLPLSLLLL